MKNLIKKNGSFYEVTMFFEPIDETENLTISIDSEYSSNSVVAFVKYGPTDNKKIFSGSGPSVTFETPKLLKHSIVTIKSTKEIMNLSILGGALIVETNYSDLVIDNDIVSKIKMYNFQNYQYIDNRHDVDGYEYDFETILERLFGQILQSQGLESITLPSKLENKTLKYSGESFDYIYAPSVGIISDSKNFRYSCVYANNSFILYICQNPCYDRANGKEPDFSFTFMCENASLERLELKSEEVETINYKVNLYDDGVLIDTNTIKLRAYDPGEGSEAVGPLSVDDWRYNENFSYNVNQGWTKEQTDFNTICANQKATLYKNESGYVINIYDTYEERIILSYSSTEKLDFEINVYAQIA